VRLTEIDPESAIGWTGLVESLLRLGREGEADDVLARARTRLGDRPEIVLLVGRQMLRRGAYAEAENVLAAETSNRDPTRQGAAWAWIAIARAGRNDCSGALAAAREALLFDRRDPVARKVEARCR
jgi:predicted Zn-dependent protease